MIASSTVFVYSDLSKRDLIGQALQSPASAPDARIQRFDAKTISITTQPAMPVMADGVFHRRGCCDGDGATAYVSR